MRYFIFLFLISLNLYSQDLPIQPEETPYLLKPFQFQMETNLGYRKDSKESKTYILPNALLKFGIIPKIELRVSYENQINTNFNGSQPLVLGLKTKLWKEKKWLPEASLITQTSLPKLASTEFKQDKLAPEFQLLLQGNYSESFSMNYNFGAKWDGFNPKPYYTYKTTSSFTISQKSYLYAEFFGHIHSFEPSHISYNNGYMYQINDDMILDLSFGLGINKYAPDYFGAIIFSFRI